MTRRIRGQSAFTEVGLDGESDLKGSKPFNADTLIKVSWRKKQLILASLIINIIFVSMLLLLCWIPWKLYFHLYKVSIQGDNGSMDLSFGVTAYCVDTPTMGLCPAGTSLMADPGEAAGYISRFATTKAVVMAFVALLIVLISSSYTLHFVGKARRLHLAAGPVTSRNTSEEIDKALKSVKCADEAALSRAMQETEDKLVSVLSWSLNAASSGLLLLALILVGVGFTRPFSENGKVEPEVTKSAMPGLYLLVILALLQWTVTAVLVLSARKSKPSSSKMEAA